MKPRRHLVALAVASLSLSGCSILSPTPLWELAKAAGTLTRRSLNLSSGEASDTVYYQHAPFSSLCIEFNPQTQTADVVPALQLELQAHQIESRVYESAINTPNCPVWLHYSAQMDWDISPHTERYESYISKAALTLQNDKGQVLSSSYYILGDGFGNNKWASTRDKLAPVVSALITKTTPTNRPPVPPPKESS
ncbi:cell division protein FtsI [Rhodoferax sp.]|uniref:cell division protein FtsI n=1 Tax=Rhodoferax sp. TaxID=50421 RepID=UPI002843B688|nr:cell division protein FtsI [Rhodoferax sp.]MDR3370105.1 cell division protein FtsI [Rhodoferax sp.]